MKSVIERYNRTKEENHQLASPTSEVRVSFTGIFAVNMSKKNMHN